MIFMFLNFSSVFMVNFFKTAKPTGSWNYQKEKYSANVWEMTLGLDLFWALGGVSVGVESVEITIKEWSPSPWPKS